MFDDSYLTTIIVSFLISGISIILIPFVLIVGIYLYKKTKSKFCIPGTLISIIILAFTASLIIPWISLGSAIKEGYSPKALVYYNQAIKTALLPSVKGEMYAELGSYAFSKKQGTFAIENFETAYKYKKSYAHPLEMLYTIKGDYEKSLVVCSQQNDYSEMAANYILLKDYNKALDAINKAIEIHPERAWNTFTRAIIYKNLGRNDLAIRDYNYALKHCPKQKDKFEQEFTNYKTAVADKYNKLKVEYGL